MPIIIVEGPKLDIERKLMEGLTKVATEVYGIEHIIVLIKEKPLENISIRGKLLIDGWLVILSSNYSVHLN